VPRSARHIPADDQIAFRQVQKARLPNLSKTEFLHLFDVWRDRYRAQQVIDDAERAALWDALNDERELLFSTHARFPEHRAELTARLDAIGRELAELQIRT
jgi:hypothetical protein